MHRVAGRTRTAPSCNTNRYFGSAEVIQRLNRIVGMGKPLIEAWASDAP